MYNEDLKKKFIIDTTTSISNMTSYQYLFKSCEKYELKYGIDVCMMNKDMISELLEDIVGVKGLTVYNNVTMLRNYIRWCISNKIPGAISDGLEVYPTGLKKMREKMVSTPLDLQKQLNILFKPEDKKMYDNVLRLFLWFGYTGIPVEDAIHLTNDNIFFDDMTIKIDDREYVIYREEMKCLKNCYDLDFFNDSHENYSGNPIRQRFSSKLILRGIKADPDDKQLIVSVTRRNRELFNSGKIDRRLSYERLSASGMYYRAYEMEISGFEVSFDKEIDEFLKGKVYKTDKNKRSLATTRRYLVRQYNSDYQKWKDAFNL